MNDVSVRHSERIIALDIIRTAALLCVIVFHVGVHFSEKYKDFFFSQYLHLGDLGVSLFIILSGFSLFLNNKNENILHFYKKRFLSIYPFYWIAYIVTSMLIFIVYQRISIEPYHFIYTIIGLDGFLLATTQTRYLIGEWYVGFILLLYIIAPFIFYLINKSYWYIILFFVISILSIQYGSHINGHFFLWHPNIMWNPTARIFEFAFGALLCIALYKNKIKTLYILIPSLICIAISLLFFKNYLFGASIISIPCYISIFIVIYIVTNKIIFKQSVKDFIQFLSKYSFLAFLYHHQIIMFFISNITTQSKHAYFSYVIYTVILSYTLAYITYKPCAILKNIILK